MTRWLKTPRVGLLFLLFFSICTVGIAALVDDSTQIYSALDKAYYLSAQDAVWVRPGYNLVILDVTIPADRKPVVTFRITDNGGQGLDRAGILTPGTAGTSFIFAYIPKNASQYVSYYTRSQGPTPSTSPVVGATAVQAGTGTVTYVSKGDGTYTATFTTAIPADYDASATHTLGIYGTRNLREFGLSLYAINVTKTFVPNGSAVSQVREVVNTTACNQCHDPLAAHGETGRRAVEICILCHTPQTVDPDTGNTVDMKVMVHKLHMGKNLPSVQSGTPYVIIGNGQSVNDFSEVTFPQDTGNCTTCHQNSSQAMNWMLNPSIEACGSCHDDVNFRTGANHVGGPATNKSCAGCHAPQGEFEFDASISGAHTQPFNSKDVPKATAQIVSITNTAPGQKPTVTFKLKDRNANDILPSKMSRLTLRLAGPTTDYSWNVSETATAATFANGAYSYTFATQIIPATATGSGSVGIEGRIAVSLTRLSKGVMTPFSYSDNLANAVMYFPITDKTAVARRQVVDIAKCNSCHSKLLLHGGSRGNTFICVQCHNANLNDGSSRPASAGPNDSVDFHYMIHKIHTGLNLENGYQIGSSLMDEATYPGDRRDCLQCHVGTSYTLPLPAGILPTKNPHNYWTPMLPGSSACLSCHDSIEAAAHALINTASIGESCSVCHKETAEFAVSKLHAR